MLQYRRLFFSVCLVIAISLMLAACARQPEGKPAAGAEAPAPPRLGSELRVAVGPDSYRTELDRANVGMSPYNAAIFETLAVVTPQHTAAPGLAERWEYRGENTWRFHLRRGVKFHDGQPFTAEAVGYTLARIIRTGGGSLGLKEGSIKIVDEYTVDITPGQLNLRLVEQLTHPIYGIIAPGTNAGEKPIGTGPYRFVEYVKGQHLLVERFDGYWGEKAGFERLRLRFMPDGNTRVLALRAGEVDAIGEVPKEAIKELSTIPGVKLVTASVGAYQALYFTIHGQPPYDLGADPAIRKATALAIDREAVVREVWEGAAEPGVTFIPPTVLGDYASKISGPSYDLAKARQILDEAGWKPGPDGIRTKDGRRLTLTLVVGFPNADEHRPLPELLQAQLKDAGIEIKLMIAPDGAAYSDRLKKGEGDLWAEVGNQNDANPAFLATLFYRRGTRVYGKWSGPGDRYDDIIDATQNAVDIKEVQEKAARAMQILIDEETAVVPVVGVKRVYALAEGIKGFVPHPSFTNQRWDKVRP